MALSRCPEYDVAPCMLSPRFFAAVFMVLAIALGFGLAHLHLRFRIDQIQAETVRLQTIHSTLHSDINALKSRNEAIKHPEHLFEYAQAELNMQPFSQTQAERLCVPEPIRHRYALARANASTNPTNEPGPWFESVGERIGLMGRAMAKE